MSGYGIDGISRDDKSINRSRRKRIGVKSIKYKSDLDQFDLVCCNCEKILR